jgi:tetratricopeptide (TPR) repeat protein
VAEETEGQDSGAEAVAGGIAGADPVAAALALAGASREEADAFLREQRALVDDQRHYVRERYKQLVEQVEETWLRVWALRLTVLLRIATAFVGVVIAAGFAFMVWGASQSNGLLIEPFSVPPDLAQHGMTGEVVAAKFLDQLLVMQAQTVSTRAAKTYVNDWGQAGIKLDIPETGVSLTALDDFLREKLGHDTHITGEIVRTVSGVSLTARTGVEGAESVIGSEADLDGLVQKLSEAVYRLTQPYRYAVYLASHDRLAEAIPVVKAVAETGPTRVDRAYSFAKWGHSSGELDGIDTSLRLLQRAMVVEPDNILAQFYLVDVFLSKSLPEQVVREYQKGLTLVASDKLGMYPGSAAGIKRQIQDAINQQLGDFGDAAQLNKDLSQAGRTPSADLANREADEHDLAAARATLVDTANQRFNNYPGFAALSRLQARILIDSEAQNWAGVLSDADAFAPTLQKYPGLPSYLPTTTVPFTAYAEARLGKIADAEAHISATPADCYDCLITRARIAELRGQHQRADWWFARAIDGQKSIPFAYAYCGQALMERRDYDGAIAKFAMANQKGPHFADPLEMWGEALMAKNQSHLALAKFAEANKYAPNWGRLHLKWGEALVYAAKHDGAKRQFALAGQLDLSNADKAELARQTAAVR